MSTINHKQLLAEYQQLRSSGDQLVLVTLYYAEGSTYRKAGARMLMTEHGQMTGLVSGGCLEGGLLLEAKKVMATGQSRTITYDMRDDEDNPLALALGCRGEVRLHLSMLEPGNSMLDFIAACYQHQNPGLLVMALDEAGADCWLGLLDGETQGALALAKEQLAAFQAQLGEQSSLIVTYEGRSYLVERVQPPFNLLILGAGVDAFPVCELAQTLGWTVQMVDHRPAYINKARVAPVDNLQKVEPEKLAGVIDLAKVDAAVVMSHNLDSDAAYLRNLLASSVPYIGQLGPRYRGEELMQRCETSLVAQIGRVFSPVGLDLGGEGPASVALSIITQVQAQAAQRPATPLASKP